MRLIDLGREGCVAHLILGINGKFKTSLPNNSLYEENGVLNKS